MYTLGGDTEAGESAAAQARPTRLFREIEPFRGSLAG
jgi:hypothetical protein